ncbi:MAG: arsenite S-adenosylmethyltransferase [Lentisphaerae bacterium GWF2_45_14]|nr:MAG: arsenite S-adenosylmethyltransferase [Lentisphaerae bacterium GWF2_45_14]
MSEIEKDKVRQEVRKRYAEIAESECCCRTASSSCCADTLGNAEASAEVGYSKEDMISVPEGSNMGLGCGNPQAIAALKEGEVMLDLGSGGGFDCFLAARQVGKNGRVIGVDMTPDMISKARANAQKGGYENVEFRLGEIEYLPVADSAVDVIISNCVINLSPDKKQVFSEAFRVLKPGGRITISDVAAVKPIPKEVRDDLSKYSGCVAGAIQVSEIRKTLEGEGFKNIKIAINEDSKRFIKDWFPGSGVEEYVRSSIIEAEKGE